MDSKYISYTKHYTTIGAGLGGWFGAIFGANLAAVNPQRPYNPFLKDALYIIKGGVRHGAIGAVSIGALSLAFKSYEYVTQDLK